MKYLLKCMQCVKRLLVCKDGGVALEFGALASGFFIALVGIVQYGIYMYITIAISAAAESASRIGSTGYGTTDTGRLTQIRQEIDRYTHGFINQNDVVITAQSMGKSGFGAGQELVTYTVEYPMPTVFLHYPGVPSKGKAVFTVLNEAF